MYSVQQTRLGKKCQQQKFLKSKLKITVLKMYTGLCIYNRYLKKKGSS